MFVICRECQKVKADKGLVWGIKVLLCAARGDRMETSFRSCGLPPSTWGSYGLVRGGHPMIPVQFGASFLTRASLTRSSWARPTSTRCQIGTRQFGAYSRLTHGSSARFASFTRFSFFTFSLHAHTFGTAQGN